MSTVAAMTLAPRPHVCPPRRQTKNALPSDNPANSSFYRLDWGVYDLRRRNDASQNAAWLAAYSGEFAPYAICWFDNLPPGDAALARSLPPGSSESSASSDYCC